MEARLRFDKLLQSHCVEMKKRKKPLIVLGDFNCPPSETDISNCSPWWTPDGQPMPGSTAEERAHLTRLKQDFDLKDSYESKWKVTDETGCTWNPEPTSRNQTRHIGMRLDLILVCVLDLHID